MKKNIKHLRPAGRVVLLAAVLILAATLFAVFRPTSSHNGTIPSNNPLNKSTAASKGSQPTSTSSSPLPSQSGSSQPSAGGPAPITPYGDFVSNHHPGGNNPTAEASSCNTSPGAICYVQFKKGDVIKKLAAETTDERGSAIWYWDVRSAGLSSGSWSVSAIATLNGQTKTAEDSLSLVIQ